MKAVLAIAVPMLCSCSGFHYRVATGQDGTVSQSLTWRADGGVVHSSDVDVRKGLIGALPGGQGTPSTIETGRVIAATVHPFHLSVHPTAGLSLDGPVSASQPAREDWTGAKDMLRINRFFSVLGFGIDRGADVLEDGIDAAESVATD